MDDKGEKTGKLSAAINVGFFKIDSQIENKMKKGKVDYLPKKDVMEWLLNLEKYSRIKDYTLTEEEKHLREMVRQNILYFDHTEATYYPQGKSYHHGIRLYFKKGEKG